MPTPRLDHTECGIGVDADVVSDAAVIHFGFKVMAAALAVPGNLFPPGKYGSSSHVLAPRARS